MFHVVRKQRMMGDPSKCSTNNSTSESISHGFHISSGRVAVAPSVRISSSLTGALRTQSILDLDEKNAKKLVAGPESSVVSSATYSKNFCSIVPSAPVPVLVQDVQAINMSPENNSGDGVILIPTDRRNIRMNDTCTVRTEKDETKFRVIHSENHEKTENTNTNCTKNTRTEKHTKSNFRQSVRNSCSHDDDHQSMPGSPLSTTITTTSSMTINSHNNNSHNGVTTPSCTQSKSTYDYGVKSVESCSDNNDKIGAKKKQENSDENKTMGKVYKGSDLKVHVSTNVDDDDILPISNSQHQVMSNSEKDESNNNYGTMRATPISSKFEPSHPCCKDETKKASMEIQKPQHDHLSSKSGEENVLGLHNEGNRNEDETTSSQTAASNTGSSVSTGRWTQEEHEAFLAGLKIYGREWKKVSTKIPTRTSAQIRSHAQKYFAKLAKTNQNAALDNNQHVSCIMTLSSQPQMHQNLTPSVRQTVEKILANPDSVKQEVEETLARLYERYQLLQQQIQQQYAQPPNNTSTSMAAGSNTSNINSTVPILRPTRNNGTNQTKEVLQPSNSSHKNKLTRLTAPQTVGNKSTTTIILKPQPTLVQSDYHMNNTVSIHNNHHDQFSTVISNSNDNTTNLANSNNVQVAPAHEPTWLSQNSSTRTNPDAHVNSLAQNSTSISHSIGRTSINQDNSFSAIFHQNASNNLSAVRTNPTYHLSFLPSSSSVSTITPKSSKLPTPQPTHPITQVDAAPNKELIALEVLRSGLRNSPHQSKPPPPSVAPPSITLGADNASKAALLSTHSSHISNLSNLKGSTCTDSSPSQHSRMVVSLPLNAPTNNTTISHRRSYIQPESNTIVHNNSQQQQKQQHHLPTNMIPSPTLTFHNNNNRNVSSCDTNSDSIITTMDVTLPFVSGTSRHLDGPESDDLKLPKKRRKTS